jgi:hypothetical protein
VLVVWRDGREGNCGGDVQPGRRGAVSEVTIQSKSFLEVGKQCPSVRLFRNNVGLGVLGSKITRISAITIVTLRPGDFVVKNGRIVDFGLFKGSGDGIGWRSVIITTEMVGKTLAQFLSAEFKTPTGRLTEEQINWARVVRVSGGCAIVARSAKEAVSQIVTGELI